MICSEIKGKYGPCRQRSARNVLDEVAGQIFPGIVHGNVLSVSQPALVQSLICLDYLLHGTPVAHDDVDPGSALFVGHARGLAMLEHVADVALNLNVIRCAKEVIETARVLRRRYRAEEVRDGLGQRSRMSLAWRP